MEPCHLKPVGHCPGSPCPPQDSSTSEGKTKQEQDRVLWQQPVGVLQGREGQMQQEALPQVLVQLLPLPDPRPVHGPKPDRGCNLGIIPK